MSSLASLLKQSPTNSAAVLAAADAALKASPNDVHTQHVKVVAQLNLDHFEDALATLKAGGAGIQRAASFEHAYALYKTGRLAEARTIAESLHDRAGRHLQAQVVWHSFWSTILECPLYSH
jgi:signal recognition particle subunit SRP72